MMASQEFPVPERIPGQLITESQHLFYLKQHLTRLCDLRGYPRFPGTQPVSFTQQSLQLLETEDFWVCEKSDGVRVMVLIVVVATPHGSAQEVYFIDRKYEFYSIDNIIFPHYEHIDRFLQDTILDGELVIDVDPKTGQHQLRFLTFDCLVWEGRSLMQRPLISRYDTLRERIIAPLSKLIRLHPQIKEKMPFDVKLKPMELAYKLEKVLNHDLPSLTHGNDGLIFTSVSGPYRIGADPKILKWKPPSKNSIDFRLKLRFPPRADDSNEADFYAKPVFVLMMFCGQEGEQFFDTLEMSDEEWIERKQRREQLDDRVVEVVWDAPRQTWKLLRFRDDKKNGNYKEVVHAVLNSIRDGVEATELTKSSVNIRKAWWDRAQAVKFNSSGNNSLSRPQRASVQRQMPSSSQNAASRWSNSKLPSSQTQQRSFAASGSVNLPREAPGPFKRSSGTFPNNNTFVNGSLRRKENIRPGFNGDSWRRY